MAIDAVVDAVKRHPDKTELWLRPRIDSEGHSTLAGRRRLLITKNPEYEPQTGDEIWGNTQQVVISKNGIDHKFGRIMKFFDGDEEVLWSPSE